jgi:hypothetical protein
VILFELTSTEQHQTYQELASENVNRQYDFLKSIVKASLAIQRPLPEFAPVTRAFCPASSRGIGAADFGRLWSSSSFRWLLDTPCAIAAANAVAALFPG